MKQFDWRVFLASVAIFIIPPLAVPSRGVLAEGITSYVYGFPFSWFTVYFESRGGKAFLVQALSEPNHGVSVSILSAVLNLIIIYVVLHAIVTVFLKKRHSDSRHKHPAAPDPQPESASAPAPEPESKPEPEKEPVSVGQSDESDGQ